MTDIDPQDLATRLGLEPLGFEGGYYRETYRSPVRRPGPELDPIYLGDRNIGTAIYYMLTPDSRSMMHRLKTDEMYHFYLGDRVELLMIREDHSHELVELGSDVMAGERVQHLVPAGTWQGSRLAPGGRFALMGTTMCPGFELDDFELGRRSDLVARYPELTVWLEALTPEVLATSRLELTAATRDLLHAQSRGLEALLKGLSAQRAPDWPLPHVDAQAVRFTLERLEGGIEQQGWWAWYIVRTSDRSLVGLVGYHGPPNDHGDIEIGYSVSEGAQGQGIATEATEALLRRAFDDERVRRVLLRVEAKNLPALRVAEKLGFERLPDSTSDVVDLARSRSVESAELTP